MIQDRLGLIEEGMYITRLSFYIIIGHKKMRLIFNLRKFANTITFTKKGFTRIINDTILI